MIPKFINWLESEEFSGLSEPQHKQGENNLNLDNLVKRRLDQLLSELQMAGKGSKEDIMNSIKNFLSLSSPSEKEQPNQDQDMQSQDMQSQDMQSQDMQSQGVNK